MAAFSYVRQNIIRELSGKADSTQIIVQLDSIPQLPAMPDVAQETTQAK